MYMAHRWHTTQLLRCSSVLIVSCDPSARPSFLQPTFFSFTNGLLHSVYVFTLLLLFSLGVCVYAYVHSVFLWYRVLHLVHIVFVCSFCNFVYITITALCSSVLFINNNQLFDFDCFAWIFHIRKMVSGLVFGTFVLCYLRILLFGLLE